MTLPHNYDEWRLRGPEEPDDLTAEERETAEEHENERGDWLRDRRDGL